MKINSIELKNFRNYEHQKIAFKDNLNILVGKNAQGKTNLLEAIYFSIIGKSTRTNKENDLIKLEKERAFVKVIFEKIGGKKTIDYILDKRNKKTIKINGVALTKISELIGCLNAVLFTPLDLKIVQENPVPRRTFLDISISQISKNYFYFLNRYHKILNERNKLLKSNKSFETICETLPIWNEALANLGSKIIFARIKFIQKLTEYAKKEHLNITNNLEDLCIEYSGIVGENEKEIEKILLNEYNNNKEKDFKLGYTTVGPHRDDIKLSINNIDARTYASQGQQRTIVLSLKLAELEIYKEETGEYPILLLDDVLSELDEKRQKKLLEKSKDVQTIITTTFIPDFAKESNIIILNNGQIKN